MVELACAAGCSTSWASEVRARWREMQEMPRTLRSRTKHGRVMEILDAGFDPEGPASELAAAAGCVRSTARKARWSWRRESPTDREVRKARKMRPQCRRCTVYGWERNPLDEESGLCLWCLLELAGVDLAAVFRMDCG